MSVDLSSLPEPARLRRAAVIHYQWGPQKFEIWCIACSIRALTWIETGELITWLHCKALPKQEIPEEEVAKMMTVLIPAHYVTAVQTGPTFTLRSSGRSRDIGIFPPTQPTPDNHLSVEEIERVIVDLLEPSRN
jgi:hypothetical protein